MTHYHQVALFLIEHLPNGHDLVAVKGGNLLDFGKAHRVCDDFRCLARPDGGTRPDMVLIGALNQREGARDGRLCRPYAR